MKIAILIVLFALSILDTVQSNADSSDIGSFIPEEHHSRILSRRKRFIIFPDGSSFQLVYCAQNHGYLQIGDIVWFGNTAALAWELPSDPKLFYHLKDLKSNGAIRRNDVNNKHILYVDEKGKVLAKVPYRKRIIVNPAFAKRSVDQSIIEKNTTKIIKEIHDKQLRIDLIKELENVHFHREGRRSLYERLESFIEALGWKGRECVLRLLCESGQDKSNQGTFVEEIIRAVFTLPKGEEFVLPRHKVYDEAHQARDCTKSFPDCVHRVTGEAFPEIW